MLNSILLLFGNLGTTELIIIVVIILLLFGGKKIPELMKGMGKGVRSFKEGMDEVKDEIEKPLQDIDNEIDTKDPGTKSNGK
jgi:sec-independent protein translocase protein TatA